MAKCNDLKIPQLKKWAGISWFDANGINSDLQHRLQEDMKSVNINIVEYVFQLELGKKQR